jgi:6-phosphogluconolactonase
LDKAGPFSLCLSGGSTPQALYRLLAQPPYRDRFPWYRTNLFWGDERFVPPEAPDSNLGMTRRALLNHITIPPANIHPMPTTGTPTDAARAYQLTLQTYYGAESLDMSRPLFDVTLLGLGENGHTASLFPDTASLTETRAWVTPVTENVPQPRLTLTYPAIACSRYVAFLVAGANKAEVLGKVWAGDLEQPASRVTAAGTLIWFIDEKARGPA